ncbi:MAG: GAF domain-containing protein [Deltaproteobacteria bacterium]|nr:GAF domain-containing protein [Deltaproteobacteria bacterium]
MANEGAQLARLINEATATAGHSNATMDADIADFMARSSDKSGFGALPAEPTTGLRNTLNTIAELIANTVEAYTAGVFLVRNDAKSGQKPYLELVGVHTLSRELVYSAKIPVGSGIVGWVAQTKQRVSVCPFEHDSRTLLYYRADQDLKSFYAIPVLSESNQLVAVITCDSKRSYAFSKLAEKLLSSFAKHVSNTLSLFAELGTVAEVHTDHEEQLVRDMLEVFRNQPNEEALFSAACDLDERLVRRDALVILALNEGGVGEGTFYSNASQSSSGNRLLDIVCKHKRIICGDRSVHALPTDDQKKRSFLSVPFHVLDKEAGSFNILSMPNSPFLQREITNVERIAKVFGRELERVRLRMSVTVQSNQLGISSWQGFNIQSKLLIRDARAKNIGVTLLRVKFLCLEELEARAGVGMVEQFLELSIRLVNQVKRNDSVACAIFGPEILIFTPTAEADNTARRFRSLLEKSAPNLTPSGMTNASIGWTKLIREGVLISGATYPVDGETLNELVAVTLDCRKQEAKKLENRAPATKSETNAGDKLGRAVNA